jgi:hypothetical protein
MNDVQTQIQGFGSTPIIKNADGSTLLSVGTVALIALGALTLYFFIPEKKEVIFLNNRKVIIETKFLKINN